MMRWKLAAFMVLLCMVTGMSGCVAKKTAVIPQPTALQKAFEVKCRNDYNLKVITRVVGRTFWIYVPTEQPLFDFSAEAPSAPDAQKKPAKYNLLYINGSYKDNSFYFDYDVVPNIKAEKGGDGIRNQGTDYFDSVSLHLNAVITETLLDPQVPISFIVVAITDIKQGIEAKYTYYRDDLRKAQDPSFEDFPKRVLQDSKGSPDFIHDETGRHLEYNDIRMADFLAKQMVSRIRSKFQQGDFPAQEDYQEAIVGVIADTTRSYDFKDFKDVHTNDIRTHQKMIFTPAQLDHFGENKPKQPDKPTGKLIHIIFEDGKTTFNEEQ